MTSTATPPTVVPKSQAALLLTVGAVDALGNGMVQPVVPFLALSIHASAFAIGALFATYAIAQLVMAPIWPRSVRGF
jgi:MFS family permease